MNRETEKIWSARDLSDSYHILFETMTEGVFFQMYNGSLVEANPAALDMFGLTREEFIGRNSNSAAWDVIREDGTPVPGEEHPSMISLQTGKAVLNKVLGIRNAATNQYIWLVVNSIPQFRKGETTPYCVMITMHNIMWRKSAEDIRKARLRILEYSHGHTLDELLQATLDELEHLTGSRIGFCHFLEADQKTLLLQSWSTSTLLKFCAADGQGRHYNVAEAGVWVDCVHQRRPVIHNNIATLPHRKGMPPGHAEVVRELVVPVFRGDKIVAIVGVGNKPYDYTDDDVEVVSRFADLAWDIAERKKTEMELRQNEEKYRQLSELMPEGIAVHTGGVIVYANSAAAQIFGAAHPDLLLGKQLMDFVHPGFRQIVHERVDEIISHDTRVPSIEEKLLRIDGTEIFAEVTAIPFKYKQQTAVQVVFNDITKRKMNDQALRESEEKFRNLFEKLNDGITLTHQGLIIDINPFMVDLLGVEDRKMLVGKNLLEFMTPRSREKALGEISLIQTGKSQGSQSELTYLKADGTEVTVEMRGSRVEIAGKIYGLSIHRDITQRNLAEIALKQKIEELERFMELTVGRELVMIRLKKEINELLKKAGDPEMYTIVE